MYVYKCDRCGRYYDDSTSSIGPTLCRTPKHSILDLCKKCKDDLIKWLDAYKHEDESKKYNEMEG